MPVLRPLVGMDKEEITAEAERLGTYPISIIPDQDCCTLFTPRHPATKAKRYEVERAEAGLPIEEIVDGAVKARDRGNVRFSRYKLTAMKITPGKLAGMKAVSDQRGVIAAAAMDQRGSLQEGARQGARRRRRATRTWRSSRSCHRSADAARQRDPARSRSGAFPRASGARRDAGLLMAYEKTGYDAATPGRLPDLLDVWSVRRLKEAGADCLKILLYYAPSDPAVDQRPQARVGRAHRRRVPRQRHPVLPRGHRLRGRRSTRRGWSSRRRSPSWSPPTCASSRRTSTAWTC